MGRIIDFIEKEGQGNYLCYKTRKTSLDTESRDTLDYDDKPVSIISGSSIAETDKKRVHSVAIDRNFIAKLCNPIFTHFLDGSRYTYKIDDMAIGSNIYPFLAGQVIVGCCERKDRDTFKKVMLQHKIVMALPDIFNIDDDPNYCRLFLEKINKDISNLPYVAQSGIKIDEILLYKSDALSKDENRRDGLLNRGISRIQTVMTDTEQLMVETLCRQNRLDDDNWLIKDGSLEYTKSSRISEEQWLLMRSNYSHVVGVSKQFNPDLILDFEKNKLSKTIASLEPFHRTKVYRYAVDQCQSEFAVWYLRLRKSDFRETHFSDVIKCEMLLPSEGDDIDSDLVDLICANLIKEAYPVCFGSDSRWANHLYPIFLTEKFCKSNYIDNNIILNLF
jgi:hypothetical protein